VCADVARADAMFAGDRAGVEQRLAVRGAIARARADLDTGRTADASAAIESSLARAREVDSPALVAEALIVAGGADKLAGKLDSGVARAREALTTAVAHVEPVQAAWAALLLVQLRHAQSAGSAGNDDLLALAAAFARQAGEPPQLQVGVLLTRATETIEAGRFAAARDDLRRVRELALQHDNRRAAALALANIGKCDDYLGDYAESVAANRQALVEIEPLLGALHPTIAGLRQNLGSILIATGDPDAALQELARVKAIVAENYPGDHPVAAAAHLNAGIAHTHRGRLTDALAEYRVALAMNERLLGPDATVVAHVLCNMGEALGALGRVDEALAASGRAVTLQSGALPADHCDRLVCSTIHGGILAAAGRSDEALRLLGSTLDRFAAGDCSPEDIGELELEFARALQASDGPRARSLLDAAERHLATPESRAKLERLRASIR
jgi:tetratricopeptide (TPR) repeat protein